MKFIVATLALCLALPSMAAPKASDWSTAAKSRARLVADGKGAGLQIELAPGAITYWRDPGEAGLPPRFDFSGSTNLARADVDFPAPMRIAEPDGSEAFGYRNAVILPVRVTPADPSQPVRLKLNADYAVCERVCLPAKASAALELPPTGTFSDELAAARASVPTRSDTKALGLTVTKTAAASWRICLASAPHDLFVEAPEGYWLQPKREEDGRCYALTLQQKPEGASSSFEARITVETGAGATETGLKLEG